MPRIAVVLLSVLFAGLLHAADAKKPNVLFILADDQRFDTIRALGNSEIHTPTLDQLVARGFTFNNAYCQGGMTPAVCTPSRTMLLTGRSLFRIPDPTVKTYDGPTLGKTFTAAGYATLCVTKPTNSFAAGHSHFTKVVHISHIGAPTSQKCADAALDFLKEQSAAKPWFVYFAPSMPHDPRTAETEFHARYDPAKLTLPKNFMPRHPFDNGELACRDELLAAIPRDETEMKKHLADYYACITGLDHHIGRIIDAVRAAGQLDNTLIVFSSDQGLAVGGRHGLMGKQNLYEHFKSPLVVAGPNIPKGKSDALVYLFDIFPTLCELTQVAAPPELEGKSLAPVLAEKTAAVRDTLFGAYRGVQRMVRDKQWKLISYPKIGRFQLFDLQHDPDELADLSEKAEHAAKLAELKTLLAAQQQEWADNLAGK